MSLLDGVYPQTGSTESGDSGLGCDDITRASVDDQASSLGGPTDAADRQTSRDDVFPHTPVSRGNGDYVGFNDVGLMAGNATSPVLTPLMSSAGYVVAWTEGKTVLPLRSVDEPPLPHADVEAQTTAHQDPELHATAASDRHDDAVGVSTSQYWKTDEIMKVLSSEEERGSSVSVESAVATRPPDVVQPQDTDQQPSAARPSEDNSISAYITLDQLQNVA